MTEEQKARKFEEIQQWLWSNVKHGNTIQSSLSAAMIRQLSIEGPEGESPDDA